MTGPLRAPDCFRLSLVWSLQLTGLCMSDTFSLPLSMVAALLAIASTPGWRAPFSPSTCLSRLLPLLSRFVHSPGLPPAAFDLAATFCPGSAALSREQTLRRCQDGRGRASHNRVIGLSAAIVSPSNWSERKRRVGQRGNKRGGLSASSSANCAWRYLDDLVALCPAPAPPLLSSPRPSPARDTTMASRIADIKADLRAKKRVSGWVLPKPESAVRCGPSPDGLVMCGQAHWPLCGPAVHA